MCCSKQLRPSSRTLLHIGSCLPLKAQGSWFRNKNYNFGQNLAQFRNNLMSGSPTDSRPLSAQPSVSLMHQFSDTLPSFFITFPCSLYILQTHYLCVQLYMYIQLYIHYKMHQFPDTQKIAGKKKDTSWNLITMCPSCWTLLEIPSIDFSNPWQSILSLWVELRRWRWRSRSRQLIFTHQLMILLWITLSLSFL